MLTKKLKLDKSTILTVVLSIVFAVEALFILPMWDVLNEGSRFFYLLAAVLTTLAGIKFRESEGPGKYFRHMGLILLCLWAAALLFQIPPLYGWIFANLAGMVLWILAIKMVFSEEKILMPFLFSVFNTILTGALLIIIAISAASPQQAYIDELESNLEKYPPVVVRDKTDKVIFKEYYTDEYGKRQTKPFQPSSYNSQLIEEGDTVRIILDEDGKIGLIKKN